jgi:hypothetical protein
MTRFVSKWACSLLQKPCYTNDVTKDEVSPKGSSLEEFEKDTQFYLNALTLPVIDLDTVELTGFGQEGRGTARP